MLFSVFTKREAVDSAPAIAAARPLKTRFDDQRKAGASLDSLTAPLSIEATSEALHPYVAKCETHPEMGVLREAVVEVETQKEQPVKTATGEARWALQRQKAEAQRAQLAAEQAEAAAQQELVAKEHRRSG